MFDDARRPCRMFGRVHFIQGCAGVQHKGCNALLGY